MPNTAGNRSRGELALVLEITRLGGPWAGLLAVAIALVVAVLESVNIAMVVPIIREVTEGGQHTGFGQKIAEILGWVGVPMTLASILLFTVALFTVRCAFALAHTRLVVRGQGRVARTLRASLYHALLHSRWQHLSSVPVSRLSNALAREVQVASTTYWQVFEMLSGVLIGAFYCAMAVITLDVPPSAAVLAGGVLLALMITFRGFVSRARRIGETALGINSALLKDVQERLRAAKTIKSFGVEDQAVAGLDRISARHERNSILSKTNKIASRIAVEWGATALLALMIYVSLAVLSLDIAQATLLILVAYRLMPLATRLQQALVSLKGELPACHEVFALMSLSEANAEDEPSAGSPRMGESLELAHIRFTYAGESKPALDDASLRLRRGTITALVGPSGAGKSTLADVVLGLLAPESGTIRVDGVVVDSIIGGKWRKGIGYVPQQAELVSGSIRDNIAWGDPDSTDEAIVAAMRSVGLDALLDRLPQGIHANIGEYGGELSGGERHRITLARALVRRPRLLVLDEPTAAIDPETELIVWNTLQRIRHDTAILVITHRLESLDKVDEVVMLRSGRVVECGPWNKVRIAHEAELRKLEGALA